MPEDGAHRLVQGLQSIAADHPSILQNELGIIGIAMPPQLENRIPSTIERLHDISVKSHLSGSEAQCGRLLQHLRVRHLACHPVSCHTRTYTAKLVGQSTLPT